MLNFALTKPSDNLSSIYNPIRLQIMLAIKRFYLVMLKNLFYLSKNKKYTTE